MNALFIYVIVIISLFVIGGCIEKLVIPHLNSDNKFKKWWKEWMVDDDLSHL
jgi:hypothetical protein